MAKSVKVNFIYNMLNTVTQMLFPLITFPYASRILMADGIGQVNFFNSIIQYIILFSSLGIPLYAVRESARVRNDEKELSKVSFEIVMLHTALTFIGYLIVFILCFSVDKIASDLPLFLLLSLNIIFNAIGCNWLFQGVEDFKYITIRGLIVKAFCVSLLFICVHSREDLFWYAFLTVMGTVGGNIFNLGRMRLYVKPSWHKWKDLDIKRHIKPCLKIFALNLIVSIYVNLDLVMLGFLKDESAVGFYTAANKVIRVMLSIVASLGSVLLPRLSNLIADNNFVEFNRLSQKAIDFIVFISIPLLVVIILLSPSIVHILYGDSFEFAIKTMIILSPLVLILGLSNVIGIQILFPQGKEKLVMVCTAIGAFINFSINILLIPLMSSNGAAIATIAAELGVTVSLLLLGHKYLPIRLFSKHNVLLLMHGCLIFFFCWFLINLIDGDWNKIIIITIIVALLYIILLSITKNELYLEYIEKLRNIISKYKKNESRNIF